MQRRLNALLYLNVGFRPSCPGRSNQVLGPNHLTATHVAAALQDSPSQKYRDDLHALNLLILSSTNAKARIQDDVRQR